MELKQVCITVGIYVGMWLLRSISDWWVAKSKTTSNTLDDYLAANFKKMIDALPAIKKKK